MSEMEKNIISEADLEKAAGGLKMDKSTLKKSLIAAGVLAAGAGVGVGGYVIVNKAINSKKGAPEPAPVGGEYEGEHTLTWKTTYGE